MTVNQTLIVCEILKRHGYGEYEMTNEGGYDSLSCYPDCISDATKSINMDGWRGTSTPQCAYICKEIMEKLGETGASDE
jgi:hypothetical protein